MNFLQDYRIKEDYIEFQGEFPLRSNIALFYDVIEHNYRIKKRLCRICQQPLKPVHFGGTLGETGTSGFETEALSFEIEALSFEIEASGFETVVSKIMNNYFTYKFP